MDPSRRTVWLALVVASAVVGTMLNAGLASGRTAAATSVTGLYMDGSGFPAGGGPVNVGPSATYTAAIALDPSVLNMSVTGGGVSLTFTFASAPGTTITTGTYTNAVRASFRGPGQNGLDVTSGSTGCSTVSGQFTVLELATDGTGAVTATAVDFEIHCESQQPAAFGSIRFQSTQGYRGIKIDPYPVPSRSRSGARSSGTRSRRRSQSPQRGPIR